MPPLLPHILHTKIATFVIFPATPLTVSRKQMFIPVHAKRGGFAAPFSAPAQKQPLRGAATRFQHHSEG
jgi:hypothetical protein